MHQSSPVSIRDKEQAFLAAVVDHDLATARALLPQLHYSVDVMNKEGRTALSLAIRDAHLPLIHLLKEHADAEHISIKLTDLSAAFFQAVRAKDEVLVSYFLEKLKIDPDTPDPEDTTILPKRAIQIAHELNSESIVRLLNASGANTAYLTSNPWVRSSAETKLPEVIQAQYGFLSPPRKIEEQGVPYLGAGPLVRYSERLVSDLAATRAQPAAPLPADAAPSAPPSASAAATELLAAESRPPVPRSVALPQALSRSPSPQGRLSVSSPSPRMWRRESSPRPRADSSAEMRTTTLISLARTVAVTIEKLLEDYKGQHKASVRLLSQLVRQFAPKRELNEAANAEYALKLLVCICAFLNYARAQNSHLVPALKERLSRLRFYYDAHQYRLNAFWLWMRRLEHGEECIRKTSAIWYVVRDRMRQKQRFKKRRNAVKICQEIGITEKDVRAAAEELDAVQARLPGVNLDDAGKITECLRADKNMREMTEAFMNELFNQHGLTGRSFGP